MLISRWIGLEYALYKGDDFIALGTMQEIANKLGVKLATLQYYRTPTFQKRTINAKKPLVFVPID